jgi:hypothetical protein
MITNDGLTALGLKIVQDESFYIEPKLDQPENRQTVRNSAEYASHYLQAHNHEAAAEAYKRMLDRLNAAHQILSQQIESWPTI